MSCGLYHFWEGTGLQQKAQRGSIAGAEPWRSAEPSIGHSIIARPTSVSDEDATYRWLNTILLPALVSDANVSNEELAQVLVLNTDPYLDSTMTNHWFAARWAETSFAGLAALMAACYRSASWLDLPQQCKMHVAEWRIWLNNQTWDTPAWLPADVFKEKDWCACDEIGWSELAQVLDKGRPGPCLSSGVPAIKSEPVWDDTQILVAGAGYRWGSARRVTWWMDEAHWVIRIAHIHPAETAALYATGSGGIYTEKAFEACAEWRGWAHTMARYHHGPQCVNELSLRAGLANSDFKNAPQDVVLTRIYQWWIKSGDRIAFTLLQILSGLSASHLANVLQVLLAADESRPGVIWQACQPVCALELPLALVD